MMNMLDGGVHADNPVDVRGGHRGAPQCAAGKPIVHLGRRIRAAVEDLAGPYLLDRAHREALPLRDLLALVDVHEVQVVLRDLSGRGLAVTGARCLTVRVRESRVAPHSHPRGRSVMTGIRVRSRGIGFGVGAALMALAALGPATGWPL
jgi:hypothetical protein